MTDDAEMGELRPDTAAELNEMILGFQVDRAEVDSAYERHNQRIAQVAAQMRAEGRDEKDIARMVTDALSPDLPPQALIDALHDDLPDTGD